MLHTFDVAVIGAGPAGAAAALCAARAGLAVALFEPQARPDKPCGEGILPGGVAALRALGLADLLARGRALERIGYVLPSGRELELALPAAGCALERPLLGEALARALEREPSLTRVARRVECQHSARGFLLRNGRESWCARTLIAADGLQGRAADWLRGPRPAARRSGLRARAEARRPLDRVEVHLGRSSEVYLTPLAGGRINVAVLREARPAGASGSVATLAAALAEHPRAASWLGAWITPPATRALATGTPARVADGGAFLAGDATGGIDPLLGCGVAIALVTGMAAARAAQRVLEQGSGEPERDYERLVRRETRVRRAVAGGLSFLAGRPRIQALAVRALSAWPAAVQRLAAQVAGA